MKISSPTKARPAPDNYPTRLRILIFAAIVLHVSVTTSIFMVGKFGVMPGQFNQDGLGNFASDGFMYRTEVLELCRVLKTRGVVAWAGWPTQLHVRLYSLPVAALNGGASFNILTIEPLNLLYYLAILLIVFKLGQLVFNYRTGLVAATMVALWPSFLLHTTQLLRDPLLVAALLLLVLIFTLGLERDYTWHRGIVIGVAAAGTIVLIRIVRLPMWPMLWATAVIAVLFLGHRILRRRRLLIGNVVLGAITVIAMTIVPHFQNAFHNQQVVNRPRVIIPEDVQALSVPEQIAVRRHGFELGIGSEGEAVPSDAGSNIDTTVHFAGLADIIRHVPRAIVVGFLAPFPNMWLGTGKEVGASGRLLSGFETLLAYMIECLALFGLWCQRKRPSAWLLCMIVTLGAVALGLVVGNIGALFRLRYPFWAVLIVLGAGGGEYLWRRRSRAADADSGFLAAQPAESFHS